MACSSQLIVRSSTKLRYGAIVEFEFDQHVQFSILVVVKTQKSFLCSPRDGVPLNFKKQSFQEYSLERVFFSLLSTPCVPAAYLAILLRPPPAHRM
jgi:hypothetical protein